MLKYIKNNIKNNTQPTIDAFLAFEKKLDIKKQNDNVANPNKKNNINI